MSYEAYYVCAKCKKELTDHQRSYSSGVCPYCGHVKPGTFCEVYKKSRLVEAPKPKTDQPKKGFWAWLLRG
jgi:DNA-directed RNA polymerase subunit RPC12/RpoP